MAGERGQALPLALVALAVGAMLVAPMLRSVSVHTIAARSYSTSMARQYSADAGIEEAIWHLKSGETEVPEGGQVGLPAFTINGNTVSVTIEDEGGQTYRVASTATGDDGSRTTIVSRVLVSGGTAGWSTDGG